MSTSCSSLRLHKLWNYALSSDIVSFFDTIIVDNVSYNRLRTVYYLQQSNNSIFCWFWRWECNLMFSNKDYDIFAKMSRLIVRHGFVCPHCKKHSIKQAALVPDLTSCASEIDFMHCSVYYFCCFCGFESKGLLNARDLTRNIIERKKLT